MKILKTIIVSLIVLTFFASCSKDSNIEINQVEENLEGKAGENLELSLKLSSEEGISQIAAESKELGLDYLENTENNPGGMILNLTVTIPWDAEVDEKYDIDVQVSDASGNRAEEVVIITVK